MCWPLKQTILYLNDLVSSQMMAALSREKRLSTESTAYSFFCPFLILWLCQSLPLFSYFFSFSTPSCFLIYGSKIVCGLTTLHLPNQVAISNSLFLFLCLCVTMLESHTDIVSSHCPLLVGRWAETSHKPLAYPSLSSSCRCFPLSLSVSSLLSCNVTDV